MDLEKNYGPVSDRAIGNPFIRTASNNSPR